jgi:hypothetical protein
MRMDRLDEIRRTHTKGFHSSADEVYGNNPICLGCDHQWPCDTVAVFSLYDRVVGERDILAALVAQLRTELGLAPQTVVDPDPDHVETERLLRQGVLCPGRCKTERRTLRGVLQPDGGNRWSCPSCNDLFEQDPTPASSTVLPDPLATAPSAEPDWQIEAVVLADELATITDGFEDDLPDMTAAQVLDVIRRRVDRALADRNVKVNRDG